MRAMDVVCIGEAVLDLVASRRGPLRAARTFEASSGGAPCNVAVGAARLGARAAFVGVVGDDEFGRLLRDALVDEGVDVSALRHDRARRTDLCFIAVDPSGERSFFYPAPSDARPALGPDDVPPDLLRAARVVHFGGGLLETASGVAAVEKLTDAARGHATVTFDPNPRLHRWADRELLRARLAAAVPRCDVVKCSAEEAVWVAGVAEPAAAARALVARGVALAIVTLGPQGAVWARASDEGAVPAPVVEVVDTTGAGDAFCAALATRLAAEGPPAAIPADRLAAHLRFACEIGSAAVTRLGAIAGVPRCAAAGPVA
jgi:fructokinase